MAGSLDHDLLVGFITVAETRSFTKAASQLHRSQSTISLQIRRLEEIVGAPLLVRTTRSLDFTRAGEKFLAYAKRIVQLQAEALSVAADGADAPVVRLGLPEDYAASIVPDLLRALEAAGSRSQLHIFCAMSTELVHRLQAGELDLVLGIRCIEPSEGRVLCAEEVVWAASRNFTAPPGPVPLAVYPAGCPFRARALNALVAIGREGRIVYTSQNPSGIEVAVRQAFAVTVRSRRTLPADWVVLDPESGFPLLPPAALELHRAPIALHSAFDEVEMLIERQVGARLDGVRPATAPPG